MTPGREEGEAKLYTRADLNEKNASKNNGTDKLSEQITIGLGGKENISDVDCCATRLRITVFDGKKVQENILKGTGASGVIQKGNGIQVIYGPRVTVIKSNLEDYLNHQDEHKEKETKEQDINKAGETKEQEKAEIKEGEKNIYAPLKGMMYSLEQVEDGVFSAKMLGDGIAIEPEEGIVTAPFDGKVTMIFDTKHAIGLMSEEGVEVLIHVGIDTVQLNGRYYDVKVSVGDKVKLGDELVYFDMEKIKEEGYQTITPIIVSNTDCFHTILPTAKGKIERKDKVLKVE